MMPFWGYSGFLWDLKANRKCRKRIVVSPWVAFRFALSCFLLPCFLPLSMFRTHLRILSGLFPADIYSDRRMVLYTSLYWWGIVFPQPGQLPFKWWRTSPKDNVGLREMRHWGYTSRQWDKWWRNGNSFWRWEFWKSFTCKLCSLTGGRWAPALC